MFGKYTKKRYIKKAKEVLKKLIDKRTIPLWICIFGLLGIFLLVSSLGKDNTNVTVTDSELYTKSHITVGVAESSEKLSRINDEGEFEGYNIDVIKLVLEDIFPGKNIRFVEIESQQASYKLKTGEIDLAIGAFTSGVTKTLKLKTSNPYYNENVYAYSADGTVIESFSEIIGKRIYATTTEFTMKSLKSALKEKGISTNIYTASSYSDIRENIKNGRADVIIAMECFEDRFAEDCVRFEEPVMTVGLRILSWTDRTATNTLINTSLQKLSDEGKLVELREKWDLSN